MEKILGNLSKNLGGCPRFGILPDNREHIPWSEARVLSGLDIRAEARTYLRNKNGAGRFNRTVLIAAAFLAIAVCGAPVWAQTELSDPHGARCAGGACDKAAFLTAFADAKTFAVVTRPMDDQMGAGQVSKTVVALGKTVQPANAADLTFVLVRINTDGVFNSPAGTPLATLRIFKGSANAGGLIWTETFSGQTDMMWPTVVNSLLQQFRAELPKTKK